MTIWKLGNVLLLSWNLEQALGLTNNQRLLCSDYHAEDYDRWPLLVALGHLSRLSYIIPEIWPKFFPEIPEKSSKILLEMFKILQKLSKIPKNSQKISAFFDSVGPPFWWVTADKL